MKTSDMLIALGILILFVLLLISIAILAVNYPIVTVALLLVAAPVCIFVGFNLKENENG